MTRENRTQKLFDTILEGIVLDTKQVELLEKMQEETRKRIHVVKKHRMLFKRALVHLRAENMEMVAKILQEAIKTKSL